MSEASPGLACRSQRARVALRHGIRLRNDGGGYNRGATHPVNAMLNYAYAVLIAQTQIRLIVKGYDPTIGIMHEKKALRGINPGFALDHMEPMRPDLRIRGRCRPPNGPVALTGHSSTRAALLDQTGGH